MARIKLELNKLKINSDGRHPIYITVTKVKARSYLTVGSAFVNEWDDDKKQIRKLKKTYTEDNIFIEDQWYKYKKIFDEFIRLDDWEPKDVFAKPKQDKVKEKTFYDHADDYLCSLKSNEGTMGYDSINSRIKKIKRFASKTLTVPEIDDEWIAGFILHCKTKEKNKTGGVGNSKNTINHAIKLIKTIVKFSKHQNWDLANHKISYSKNVKSKLTDKEIEKIAGLQLSPGTLLYHSRNIFLAQFYLRGMRIGDMLRLQKSSVKEQKLYYTAGKSPVIHQIKIVEPLMVLLSEYLEGEGYLFPFVRPGEYTVQTFKNEVKNRTMVINRNLKTIAEKAGIDKAISTHIARHTFAAIADKKLGGDLKHLQSMLGHSSRAMTEIYIRDLRKYDEMDDVADKIF